MRPREITMSDSLAENCPEQAREALNAFLDLGRDTFRSLKIGSIDLDYSPDSVRQLAHHIASEIEAGRLAQGDRDVWLLRLGYYFGEALCRARPGLSWGTGDPNFAFANHPVVTGFAGDEEAAVIVICQNITESVASGHSPPSRIDTTIKLWFEKPASAKR